MATTHNYWNLKNEHLKNLLVISLTMALVVLALISSRILVSSLFVLLHGFIRPMSGMEILTGIVIFSFVGFLFHKSKSIFLITGIHGTGNFLLTIFVGANIPLPRHLDRLLAFGIMFMAAYILLKRTRGIEGTISSIIPNIKYKNHLTKSL